MLPKGAKHPALERERLLGGVEEAALGLFKAVGLSEKMIVVPFCTWPGCMVCIFNLPAVTAVFILEPVAVSVAIYLPSLLWG